jgi:hypothetical protein
MVDRFSYSHMQGSATRALLRTSETGAGSDGGKIVVDTSGSI